MSRNLRDEDYLEHNQAAASGRGSPVHSLCFWKHRAESKVVNERIKISVAEQQGVVIFNTAGRDHGIYSLAYSDPSRSQSSEVPGRLNRYVLPAQFNNNQRREQLSGLVKLAVTSKPLEYLGQNKVSDSNRFRPQQGIELLRFRCCGSSKVVDPNAGIDQDHLSVLIASRSPCQFSLPRKRRICSCWRKRSTVRSPSSTASRLVFSPVARSVSFISLSSITMFVRIVCISSNIHTHYSAKQFAGKSPECTSCDWATWRSEVLDGAGNRVGARGPCSRPRASRSPRRGACARPITERQSRSRATSTSLSWFVR